MTGRNGISRITAFDPLDFACQIAGEIRDFRPEDFVERKEIKKMGRFIQFAIAASDFAMAMAGLKITAEDAERVGVYIGSGIGGFEVIEREHRNLLERGPGRISPFFIPATIINLASGHVSIRTGAKGPNSATATACTTSAHAIGDSFRLIQHGDADAMICGGSEAPICPMGIGGFAAMRALSTRNHEPEKASRPWDKQRDGFVVGEGAGILVLEELERAKRRGATIVAEIGGLRHERRRLPHHRAVRRRRRGLPRNAQRACGTLAFSPARSTTSTPTEPPPNSATGPRPSPLSVASASTPTKLAISSTKSMVGHLLGGAGGLEAGITALAIRDQIAPPTINYEFPDPACDLDYIPNRARPMHIEYALSNSFGFGGTNGCLILKRYAGD